MNSLYEKYERDIKLFNSINRRYKELQENDGYEAYKLMKDSWQMYNRFSYIRCEIRKEAARGQLSAEKERIYEMCKFLDEVHTDSRMIWKFYNENIKKEEI